MAGSGVDVALSCSCGEMRGWARGLSPRSGLRLRCYCRSCQRYAHALGRADALLDEHGGSEVFQLTPASVELERGTNHLACLRLTSRGVHRWYARCCKTPLANTLAPWAAFASLFTVALQLQGLGEVLGPVRYRLQAQDALGRPEGGLDGFPVAWKVHTLPRVLWGSLRGRHRPSPFYDDQGRPRVKPVRYDPSAGQDAWLSRV